MKSNFYLGEKLKIFKINGAALALAVFATLLGAGPASAVEICQTEGGVTTCWVEEGDGLGTLGGASLNLPPLPQGYDPGLAQPPLPPGYDPGVVQPAGPSAGCTAIPGMPGLEACGPGTDTTDPVQSGAQAPAATVPEVGGPPPGAEATSVAVPAATQGAPAVTPSVETTPAPANIQSASTESAFPPLWAVIAAAGILATILLAFGLFRKAKAAKRQASVQSRWWTAPLM